MYRNDPENIKAIHLIEKILDLKSMTEPTEPWTEEFFIDNYPRQLRILQINCLSNVFCPELVEIHDLRIKAENILNGLFIEKRNIKNYKILIEKIKTSEMIQEVVIEDIKDIYLSLLKFREFAENFKSYNSNVIESYGVNHFPIRLQSQITQNIDLSIIDKNLNLIIDPLDRTISKKDLIINNNYPKENSLDVDIDWM